MIPTSNLACLLRQSAQRYPDRPGLIWGGRRWTWSEIARRVDNAAAGLARLGVRRGDRVLVHARNSNTLFESMWAIWTLGAVWVPSNHRLSPAEISYLAGSCRAVAHVFDDIYPEHAAAARDANPAAAIHLRVSDWDGLAQTDAQRLALADMDRDDPAWFFYTSGTTGRPKAGVLTHGQMAFVVTNHLCDLMPGTTERDVSLVVAPLSHGAGMR